MVCAYLATHFEPLLLGILLVQVDALHQFFPFFRLDGYYVASDLIGVPDLFMRMRPMLMSFIPGRPMHPLVKGLKPWARYAVATWVYLTFAVILGLYVLLIKAMPKVLATAYGSLMEHLVEIGYFVHHGKPGYAAIAVFDEISLLFPLFAIGVTVLVLLRQLLKLWMRMHERPTWRVATAIAALAILVLSLPTLSAPRNYQPIQPSDKGTVPGPAAVEEAVVPRQGSSPAAAPLASHAPSTRPGNASPVTSSSSASSPSPSPSAAAASPSASPSAGASPSPSPAASPSPSPSQNPAPSPSPSPS
jgi:putative peptide zinc metalloprotease protein